MSQIIKAIPAKAYAETATASNITPGAIPMDDTLPQDSEGTLLLTLSIRLRSANSKVLVRAVINGTPDTAVAFLILTAFRSTSADSKGASITRESAEFHPYLLEFVDSPAVAGEVTYTVRIGLSSGNFGLNSSAGIRFLGGVLKSTLILEEIF